MTPDIQLVISNALQKFHGLKMNTETLEFITVEVNKVVREAFPGFNIQFYIEPYYIKDEHKLKFLTHKVH